MVGKRALFFGGPLDGEEMLIDDAIQTELNVVATNDATLYYKREFDDPLGLPPYCVYRQVGESRWEFHEMRV